MTTSTRDESGSPAWELSGDQRCLQIASLRHACSLHALDITGICLACASMPVPKTPYIRHEDSQYHSPKCMLLPKVHPKIVCCCNVWAMPVMTSFAHVQNALWEQDLVQLKSQVQQVRQPVSCWIGLSHNITEVMHDSHHDFSLSTASCPILTADHADYRRVSSCDVIPFPFALPVYAACTAAKPKFCPLLPQCFYLNIVSDKRCMACNVKRELQIAGHEIWSPARLYADCSTKT